jgi:O-antigen/teichoic acid export membrane protein
VSGAESDEANTGGYASAAGRLGKGAALTWLAWVAARALALVTLVLLTRALSAEDLGALLAALAAGLLGATLATGGLPDATTRSAISEAESGFGRGDINRALIRFAAVCPAVLGLVFAIVSRKAGELDWSLLASSSLLAVTQGGTSIIASVFRARGQAGRYALVTNLVASIGRTGVAIVALGTGLSASLVLWTFVLVNCGVIVGAWGGAVRDLPSTTSSAVGAASLHLGGAVWSLLQNLDVVVVGLVVGASGAGTYGAALRLAEFTLLLLIAMSVLYLPEAAKLVVADSRQALVMLYRTSSRWSALLTLLIAGTGFIVAPDVAQLLLPEQASTATAVMRVLLPGYALHGALGLAYGTSVALGAYRTISQTALVAIPLLVVLTVAFTELWGLRGAAAATLSGYVTLTIWWVLRARELLGALPFDRLFARSVVACIISWAISGIAAYLTRAESPLTSLIATAAVALISWLVVVRLAGALSAPELRALARLGGRGLRFSRA